MGRGGPQASFYLRLPLSLRGGQGGGALVQSVRVLSSGVFRMAVLSDSFVFFRPCPCSRNIEVHSQRT